MHHFLKAIVIAAILGLHAHGQDTYVNGGDWYGHKVDSCYIDFDRIRDSGDPQGVFSYAKRHVGTMTHFTHGEPVVVMRTREVEPDDVTLTLVRRVGENEMYWTDPAALSTRDPFENEKAEERAARLHAEKERFEKAQEQSALERQQRERVRAALKLAQPPRRPIATERYWQVGNERFRGKLVNANASHVKLLKSGGETIVVDRRHLSETSDSYVSEMLRNLQIYREHQGMGMDIASS